MKDIFVFVAKVTPKDWRALPRKFKRDERIYRFHGHDYGCARDDAMYGRVETISCSESPTEGPFFTVPVVFIRHEDGTQPRGDYVPLDPDPKFNPSSVA